MINVVGALKDNTPTKDVLVVGGGVPITGSGHCSLSSTIVPSSQALVIGEGVLVCCVQPLSTSTAASKPIRITIFIVIILLF